MTYIQDWYYMQLEMAKAERKEEREREMYDPDYFEDEDVPEDFRVNRETDCPDCLSYLDFINCNIYPDERKRRADRHFQCKACGVCYTCGVECEDMEVRIKKEEDYGEEEEDRHCHDY